MSDTRTDICVMFNIVERQAKDHLQGGIYNNPSDEVIGSASIVPVHNKASESDLVCNVSTLALGYYNVA